MLEILSLLKVLCYFTPNLNGVQFFENDGVFLQNAECEMRKSNYFHKSLSQELSEVFDY